MVISFKRIVKEHEISFEAVKKLKASKGSLGNPRIVSQQSLDLGHSNVTVDSSGGGGAQLHTTTTKTYNTETLECLICTGPRENHYILDNFEIQQQNPD